MRREATERQAQDWAQWCKGWGSFGKPGWGRVSRLDEDTAEGGGPSLRLT